MKPVQNTTNDKDRFRLVGAIGSDKFPTIQYTGEYTYINEIIRIIIMICTHIFEINVNLVGTENSNKCLLTSVFKLYCPVIKNYSAYIR